MSDIASGSYPSPFADLGGSLRRNRRRMLLTFLGSTALFGSIAFVMPPSYRAESVLMVRLGPEYLVNGDPATTSLFPEHQEIVASEAAILQAPELAQQVIQQIGLARIYPSLAAEIDPQNPLTEHEAMEKAIIKLDRRLSVLPVKETTLIDVTFKNPDPEVASEVLQAVVNGYLHNRRKYFEYGNGGASQEIASASVLLAQRSRDLDAYKQANGITDIDRQTAALFDQMVALVHDRDQAALDAQGKASEARALAPMVDGKDSVVLATTTSPGPGAQAVRTELAKLQIERNSAAITFKADTPQLQDVQHQIGMTQSLLYRYGQDQDTSITTGRSREYDDLAAALAKDQAEAVASGERLRVANDAIAAVSTQINRLDHARSGYLQAMREVKAAEDAYFMAAKRDSEAAAHDQMMEVAKPNVEVVQTARPPFEETWTRVIIAAAGVLIGLLGAGTIFYMDEVGRGWRTN